MSKNVKVNGTTYNGVSKVKLPLAANPSSYAEFQDTSEIVTPTGSKSITENGTHDVTAYATAIVNVAGGGTDWLQYTKSVARMFDISYGTAWSFPSETIEIHAPNAVYTEKFLNTNAFSAASQANRGCKKIILYIQDISISNNSDMFKGVNDLEEIELHTNSGVITPNRGWISYLPALKKLTGVEIAASDPAWQYNTNVHPIYFPTGSVLEEIRFKANSFSSPNAYNLSVHSALSDASLISIANGLVSSNQQTLQLHSTPKARLASIMGTVSQVSDGGSTYDFFTANANGATSLQAFITTTKGWTLG